ncbi:MAG: TM2 domain-containing protein [Treponema sp.]|nr:TM2 domain-containing protein [Treponema sp.]
MQEGMQDNGFSRKSKLAAAVLCCWMGIFGVHRFYLGIKGGVLMLVLALLVFTAFVPLVMAVIDFYMIVSGRMRDGEGRILHYWATNE